MQSLHKPVKKRIFYFYDEFRSHTMNLNNLRRYAQQRHDLHMYLESKPRNMVVLPVLSVSDDIYEHFSLFLVSSVSYKRLRTFCKNEVILFDYRLSRSDNVDVVEYFYGEFLSRLKNIKVDGNRVIINSDAEYCPHTQHTIAFRNCQIFVHFRFLIEAVSSHDVSIDGGLVEIRAQHVKMVILNVFRRFLNQQALQIFFLYRHNADSRIMQLYDDLFSVSKKVLGVDLVSLSNEEYFFPPCISGVMARMRSEKGLKHRDRLVLIRFLKDVGMSVEKCIDVFRANFKGVSEDAMKQHVYSIRHAYGLEGGRKRYDSYSCVQMIGHCKENDAYGCPYKKDPKFVSKYLALHGFADKIPDIEVLLSRNDYQNACACTLKNILKMPDKEFNPVKSPVEYFKAVKSFKKVDNGKKP